MMLIYSGWEHIEIFIRGHCQCLIFSCKFPFRTLDSGTLRILLTRLYTDNVNYQKANFWEIMFMLRYKHILIKRKYIFMWRPYESHRREKTNLSCNRHVMIHILQDRNQLQFRINWCLQTYYWRKQTIPYIVHE